MIETLANVLLFLDREYGYFEINAGNDKMIFTSDEGGPSTIDIADGTYDGAALATQLQTKMNADDTLTGTGTITFAVTYDTDTEKFTIDAGSGKTIAYTHTGSDAGLTLGFNADHSAAQTITSNLAAGDPTTVISNIHNAVEEYVKTYCKRTFESTAYTLERYSGNGHPIINLDKYPLTAVDRVAIGALDVLQIKNTNAYTSASVSVTSTGLRLVKDGTADETVLFATYATISAVATAVTALSGWTASVISTTYNSYKSSDLIDVSAKSAIDSTWVYLQIPDDAESDIQVDFDRGQIRNPGGFPSGFRNVFVDYTAGYAAADMPEDLKLAVKMLVQFLYGKRSDETFGVDFFNIGTSGTTGVRSVFEKKPLPMQVRDILNRYRRMKL